MVSEDSRHKKDEAGQGEGGIRGAGRFLFYMG